MHAELFTYVDVLDRKALLAIAKKVGLNEKQFLEDLESEAVADVVARDKREAENLGLEGTPTIYINGRHYSPEVDDLESWIDLEVKHPTAPRGGLAVEAAKADKPASVPPARGGAPAAKPNPAPSGSGSSDQPGKVAPK